MKRWTIRIMFWVVLVFGSSNFLGNIDYWRISHHEKPLFVFVGWDCIFDGGTYVGLGFGYHIISNHGVYRAMGDEKIADADWYWTEGPELRFWFIPFLNKSDLKFRGLKKP